MSWVKTAEAKLWIQQHALKTESSTITTNGVYDKGSHCAHVRSTHGAEYRYLTPSLAAGLLQDAEVVSTTDDAEVCLGDPDKDRPPDNAAATPPTQESVPTQPTPDDPITQDTATSTSSASPTSISSHTTSSSAQTESTKLCQNRTEADSDNSISCSPTVITVLLSNHPGYIALILVASLALVVVIAVFSWKSGLCRRGNRKKARYKSVSKFFPFSYSQGEGSQVAMPELGLPKAMPAEREMLLNESDEDEL